MNNKFITGILIATAAITGSLTQASAASAGIAANSPIWNGTQPTIFSGASKNFDHTPFQSYVQAERIERVGGQQKLDASKLFLKHDYDVNLFFINEGAKSKNQLAYEATGTTNKSGLLFKDASCRLTIAPCINNVAAVGTYSGTLKAGDGVNIGNVKGGSLLDFFLKKTYGTQAVYGTQSNPDGLEHVFASAVKVGQKKYLMLGFENQYGALGAKGGKNEQSDRDFNDVVFVVDIGDKNMKCLTTKKDQSDCAKTPEPASAIGLLGLGAAALIKRRRH